MNVYRTLLLLTFSLLTACSSTSLESKTYKSYSVGSVAAANIGSVFLVDQSGTIKKVKRWVGILYSEDGWQISQEYSPDFVRRELIYSGKIKNTIEVSYREFRGGLAAQAFYQSVKYDLDESRDIAFQNFKFHVIEATNSNLKVKILSD